MGIQWGLVGPLIAALVGIASLALAIYKSLNRRANAHTQATNSLALAKALADLPVDDEDENDAQQRKVLQRRLQEVGYFHTQLYVSSAAPYLTSWWQPAVFYTMALLSFIWFVLSPVTGSAQDELSVLFYVMVPFTFVLAGLQAMSRVDRNKAVYKKLSEETRLFSPPAGTSTGGRFWFEKLHALNLFAASRARKDDA